MTSAFAGIITEMNNSRSSTRQVKLPNAIDFELTLSRIGGGAAVAMFKYGMESFDTILLLSGENQDIDAGNLDTFLRILNDGNVYNHEVDFTEAMKMVATRLDKDRPLLLIVGNDRLGEQSEATELAQICFGLAFFTGR